LGLTLRSSFGGPQKPYLKEKQQNTYYSGAYIQRHVCKPECAKITSIFHKKNVTNLSHFVIISN